VRLGGQAVVRIELDDAEHKPTRSSPTGVALLAEVTRAGRRVDGEYGQVTVGEMVFMRPGGHRGDHNAEMTGTRFGTPPDPQRLRVLGGVQVHLETWWTVAGAIGLAVLRARAWH
jgi:hypothetical protein